MSWQTLHNDALAADILQILRAHQAELEERGQARAPPPASPPFTPHI